MTTSETTTEEEKPLDLRASIIEEGREIWAVMQYEGILVRERIPRQIHKWSSHRQAEYLQGVNERLIAKLPLLRKDELTGAAKPNRKARRAAAKRAS